MEPSADTWSKKSSFGLSVGGAKQIGACMGERNGGAAWSTTLSLSLVGGHFNQRDQVGPSPENSTPTPSISKTFLAQKAWTLSTLVAMDEEREIRAFRRQCVAYLDNVLSEIRAFGEDAYILDDEHLADLNVRTAEPLDVDEETIDSGDRFFCPRFSLEQARQITTDLLDSVDQDMLSGYEWPKRCRRGSYVGIFDPDGLTYDPEERHPLCDLETCAMKRLSWMLQAMGGGYADGGVWEGSDWGILKSVACPSHFLPPLN